MRAKLAWFCNIRLDILYATMNAEQFTKRMFNREHIPDGDKIISYVHKRDSKGILFPQLNLDSLYIAIYTDSWLENNDDLSSQIGFIVVL